MSAFGTLAQNTDIWGLLKVVPYSVSFPQAVTHSGTVPTLITALMKAYLICWGIVSRKTTLQPEVNTTARHLHVSLFRCVNIKIPYVGERRQTPGLECERF